MLARHEPLHVEGEPCGDLNPHSFNPDFPLDFYARQHLQKSAPLLPDIDKVEVVRLIVF